MCKPRHTKYQNSKGRRDLRRPFLSFVMYKVLLLCAAHPSAVCCCLLFAAGIHCKSATANKQSDDENQAAGINAEIEVSHLAATAAKEEDNQQNPSAVATATAFVAAATAAVSVVEHSVEHFLPPFAEIFGFRI